MPSIILWVALFTFIVHYIDTLSYSVRIAGVRTGNIALSRSLFNILFLGSRLSIVIQAPLLTNYVEKAMINNQALTLTANFRFIIFAATIAGIIGVISIPTFHRLMARAINRFKETRSIPRLILSGLTTQKPSNLSSSFKLPGIGALRGILNVEGIPFWLIFSNVLVVAIHTIGVLSAIYAGTLIPAYRATAITLSFVVNFLATILYFVFVDPVVALMTDQTMAGDITQGRLRRVITFLVAGKTVGTLLSQLLFLPAAGLIALVARFLSNII